MTHLKRMAVQMPRMRDPILIVDDQLDALNRIWYRQQLLLESELQFELRAERREVESICLCDCCKAGVGAFPKAGVVFEGCLHGCSLYLGRLQSTRTAIQMFEDRKRKTEGVMRAQWITYPAYL